jgi:superfamily I DNA/RNA helicase
VVLHNCIYSFKGCAPDAFLNPPLSDEAKVILEQSYRLPQAVLDYSQAWVQRLSVREPKAVRARDAEGEVTYNYGATWKYPEPLLPALDEALAQVRRVMVLTTCGYMLSPLLRALRDRGYPFHNPYVRHQTRWNPLGGGRGDASLLRLRAYLRPSPELWGEHCSMWRGVDLVQWAGILRAKGNLHRGMKKRLKDELAEDERILSIEELRHYLTDEALGHALDLDLEWLLEAVEPARRKTLEYPCHVVAMRGAETLLHTPRIVVGTVHSVKGGEADTVFLFPDLSRAGMESYLGAEGREAVIRTMYVGMTRARERLVLCAPATRCYVPLP